jgi:hypothetical protein
MPVYLPPEPPSWIAEPAAPPQYQRAAWTPRPPVPRGPGPHDTVASSVLTGLLLVSTIVGVAVGVLVQWVLHAFYLRLGVGYFESSAVVRGQWSIVLSQIVVFAASVVLTRFLMQRKRTSFYVPLLAGLIAALTFWLLMLPILYSDHSLGSVA